MPGRATPASGEALNGRFLSMRTWTFSPATSANLVALDDAMQALGEIDPRKNKVVELKFFGGRDTKEIAGVLGVSEPTVLRDWKLAKVWLLRELTRT